MTTLCEACDWADDIKLGWRRARCLNAPMKTPRQFVVIDPFLIEPPFELCRYVNPEGRCPDYKEKKDADNE